MVYRCYATLYFVFVVDGSESELGVLDLIQVRTVPRVPFSRLSIHLADRFDKRLFATFRCLSSHLIEHLRMSVN